MSLMRRLTQIVAAVLTSGTLLFCGMLDAVAITPELPADWTELVNEPVFTAGYYDAVTSIKNQKTTSTCWAFALCSAAETSLIKQGYTDKSIDLSEQHFSWFTHEDKGLDAYETLTNAEELLEQLHSGLGFTYDEGRNPIAWGYYFDPAMRNDTWFEVVDCEYKQTAEVMEIKQMILKHGSVTSLMYVDEEQITKRIYKAGEKTPDGYYHWVQIVGWNDNLYNSGRGGWICKDSASLTDNGYIYIDYDDYSLQEFIGITVRPRADRWLDLMQTSNMHTLIIPLLRAIMQTPSKHTLIITLLRAINFRIGA